MVTHDEKTKVFTFDGEAAGVVEFTVLEQFRERLGMCAGKPVFLCITEKEKFALHELLNREISHRGKLLADSSEKLWSAARSAHEATIKAEDRSRDLVRQLDAAHDEVDALKAKLRKRKVQP